MRDHIRRHAIGCLVVAALLLAGLLTSVPAAQAGATGSFERHTFRTPGGTWDYMVYVPSDPRPQRPLVVYIPGALQTAEQAAYDTRWNELAESEGFFVLYPEANLTDGGYFPYMEQEHQHRGAGAPLAIAGMTELTAANWAIDRRRIFVGGASNGAAMTNIMAASYPDLFAAAFALAGCPYKGDCSAGSPQGAPPEHSAGEIVREMGPRARVMPFLVMHGSADPAVPQVHSERTVRSWLLANDMIDNGELDESIPTEPALVEDGRVDGGRTFTVSHYVGSRGHHLGAYWLIHEMRHAYPGGRPGTTSGIAVNPDSQRKVSASGVDVDAPDGTTIAYEFFLAHPMQKRRY